MKGRKTSDKYISEIPDYQEEEANSVEDKSDVDEQATGQEIRVKCAGYQRGETYNMSKPAIDLAKARRSSINKTKEDIRKESIGENEEEDETSIEISDYDIGDEYEESEYEYDISISTDNEEECERNREENGRKLETTNMERAENENGSHEKNTRQEVKEEVDKDKKEREQEQVNEASNMRGRDEEDDDTDVNASSAAVDAAASAALTADATVTDESNIDITEPQMSPTQPLLLPPPQSPSIDDLELEKEVAERMQSIQNIQDHSNEGLPGDTLRDQQVTADMSASEKTVKTTG
ncbi:hypothetical protein SprV_0702289200 [Sparganum proliferum]